MADALTSAGVGVLRYDDRGGGLFDRLTMQPGPSPSSFGRGTGNDYFETRDDVNQSGIGRYGIAKVASNGA